MSEQRDIVERLDRAIQRAGNEWSYAPLVEKARDEIASLRKNYQRGQERFQELDAEIASLRAQLASARKAMTDACDLLAERTYGSDARSPGHNARLKLEAALTDEQGKP